MNKAVTIQLDQLSRFETLLTALIEAGTNRVENVELLSGRVRVTAHVRASFALEDRR